MTTTKTEALSNNPYAEAPSDLVDNFGHIEPLRPKVTARAQRVVGRFHGEHPVDELLDILGITETP